VLSYQPFPAGLSKQFDLELISMHGVGYKLANDGQDTRSIAHYLGHRNLQSTARYTALSPHRFKDFFKD
jgi:site-specific recombinase XerD